MFDPKSRYANAGRYAIRTSRGETVTVTRLPIRAVPPLRGFHARTEGQRLDHISAHHLADATAFWRLCDASEVLAPDALAMRDRIAIPKKEG
jgi:hypothetical protein